MTRTKSSSGPIIEKKTTPPKKAQGAAPPARGTSGPQKRNSQRRDDRGGSRPPHDRRPSAHTERKSPRTRDKGTEKAHRQGAAPPPDPDEEEEFRVVGGPLNDFGTRYSKRIVCKKCGVVDHVSSRARNEQNTMCSQCALAELKTLEFGHATPRATKDAVCFTCAVTFQLPKAVEDDGEKLCRDCLMGIAGWSGSLTEAPEHRGAVQSTSRPAGTKFRPKRASPAPQDPLPAKE